MLILLPSYKRTAILPWVIQSILQCDTQGIDERVCILLVNNYFPNKTIIEEIIAKLEFKDHFCCEVIHREKTLPAVESWFNAIFERACENEVIMLLGDDDLMLPWGLKNRYQAITEHKVDMLVSDFYERVYFSEDGANCVLIADEPIKVKGTPRISAMEYVPIAHHRTASFVSSHCYRNTQALRDGYEKAISWSATQDWVPYAFASGNLPLYMSYSVRQCGGQVVSFKEKSTLRGALFSEIISQEYSDGCSTAFYCLLLYQMFSNQKLHEDNKIMAECKKTYLNWLQTNGFDLLTGRIVQSTVLLKTIARSGLKLGDLVRPWLFLKGMTFSLLKYLPGVRGFCVKRELGRNSVMTVTDFLFMLRAINDGTIK